MLPCSADPPIPLKGCPSAISTDSELVHPLKAEIEEFLDLFKRYLEASFDSDRLKYHHCTWRNHLRVCLDFCVFNFGTISF